MRFFLKYHLFLLLKTHVIEPEVMTALLSYWRTATAIITRMVIENSIQSRPTIMKALQYIKWKVKHHSFVLSSLPYQIVLITGLVLDGS